MSNWEICADNENRFLRLCPFCGGEAEIKKAERLYYGIIYRVGCSTPGCCGAWYDSVTYLTEEAAVEAWNGCADRICEPESSTLYIYITRGEHRVRETINKAFGSINRVVIDVDGEEHEYNADSLIALLEELEVRDE